MTTTLYKGHVIPGSGNFDRYREGNDAYHNSGRVDPVPLRARTSLYTYDLYPSAPVYASHHLRDRVTVQRSGNAPLWIVALVTALIASTFLFVVFMI